VFVVVVEEVVMFVVVEVAIQAAMHCKNSVSVMFVSLPGSDVVELEVVDEGVILGCAK
jgi:hypothetical protein